LSWSNNSAPQSRSEGQREQQVGQYQGLDKNQPAEMQSQSLQAEPASGCDQAA
jgi:hypothetical protein